jgi:FtsZ-binding cell division protein ZapB
MVHMGLDDLEQFGLLEQKIESLISLASSLKKEKINLAGKVQSQEEKLGLLAKEIETLKADRDLVRRRIVALLEKIEKIEESAL